MLCACNVKIIIVAGEAFMRDSEISRFVIRDYKRHANYANNINFCKKIITRNTF